MHATKTSAQYSTASTNYEKATDSDLQARMPLYCQLHQLSCSINVNATALSHCDVCVKVHVMPS
jgi:hypothetical protein